MWKAEEDVFFLQQVIKVWVCAIVLPTYHEIVYILSETVPRMRVFCDLTRYFSSSSPCSVRCAGRCLPFSNVLSAHLTMFSLFLPFFSVIRYFRRFSFWCSTFIGLSMAIHFINHLLFFILCPHFASFFSCILRSCFVNRFTQTDCKCITVNGNINWLINSFRVAYRVSLIYREHNEGL